MNVKKTSKFRYIWAALVIVLAVVVGVAVASNNDYISDPWIEPGVMPTEQKVGLAQHEQLRIRLLTGQSGR